MPTAPRRVRQARHATVVRREQLTPGMVRVVLTGPDLAELGELPFTDHYVKLLFPPPGADYSWPFDPEEIRTTRSAELWPVTRTYTIRWYDAARAEIALDFVVHGDAGLAGPWARDAQVGDAIQFFGPGGAYAPDHDAEIHLFAGDEAALPAIAASLERLPATALAEVYVEVAGEAEQQPLPTTPGTRVHWVHRTPADGYGEAVARAVRSAGVPAGRLQAFVHGNADLVADLRRFLFVEQGVDRRQVSISGYWRTGHTEDRWQATKREFNESMEEAERRLAARA
jgi:NADPH-dependent ferric siderophore reductase